MHFLKKVFNFYIDSSIHIGLSVYALSFLTMLLFELPYDAAMLHFTFFSTIVTYNFIKYGSSARQYFFMTDSYGKSIQIFSFLCFGFVLLYAFQLRWQTLLVAVGFSFLSSLYIVPFLPNQKNFRSLPGFKIVVVAICWAGVTVLLPLLNAKFPIVSQTVGLLFLQRMLFVLILLIPFEISDIKYDAAELGTLPQRVGVLVTKQLTYGWIVLFFVIDLFIVTPFKILFWQLTVIVLILFVAVWQSRVKRRKYFTAFWVEGIPIAWLLIVLLFRN